MLRPPPSPLFPFFFSFLPAPWPRPWPIPLYGPVWGVVTGGVVTATTGLPLSGVTVEHDGRLPPAR